MSYIMALDQGTTSMSASEMNDAIDFIGGLMGANAGTDMTFLNVVVMKDSFDFALSLVSDVARNPAFAQEEIDRQRQQILSSLKVSYEDPEYLANVVFDRLVYGFHPYGKPNSGTPESISKLTRDDLIAFHKAYFAPNNAILAIVGDFDAAQAKTWVEKYFGGVPRGQAITRPTVSPVTLSSEKRLVHEDRVQVPRLYVLWPTVGVKNDDRFALGVLGEILGGSRTARIKTKPSGRSRTGGAGN